MKKAWKPRVWQGALRRLARLWPHSEHSDHRVMESVLSAASLYGVDMAHSDPRWFSQPERR
ncbi:hypothetical protein [Nissabacter sp. SGAir0207]|uniref:hypothetical protein n=1 Tax=Nissabacter sp. SGAir0207 TaxID=2126321 RepID=UPI0010CD0DD1|nr:hypothetical protein [Nissabacter sp. SGAir0207]QCR35917.1 hypothetical protein C1N62_07385 [Nissabacter sp. SGAir0207]